MRAFILYISFFCLVQGIEGNIYAQSTGSERQQVDGKKAYIEGLQEFENKNYERALDLLSAAYVRLPENAGINFALADAYLKVDNLADAAFYGKKAAKLDPQNKWYHLKLAEIYRNAGRNEATIEALKTALRYHPKAEDILFELAQTHAAYGNLLESNQYYNKLLKLSGDDINIRLQKLRNFQKLAVRDSILSELKAIQDLDPDNLSTLQALSNTYLDIDRPDKAKSILKEALERNSRDPKTLIMLADLYVSESKWDTVSNLLQNIISDPVVNPEAKLTVAQYLISQFRQAPDNTQLQEATTRLVDAFVSEEPEFASAHGLAAEFYLQTGQDPKALQSLAKTNELNPSNDDAWSQRMQLLLQRGRYQEAIEIGKTARSHVPQDPFILYFNGSAYLATGNHEQAVDLLGEAADLPARKPLKTAILQSLGDAHAGIKNWDRAFANYERVLNLDPANLLVLNNYAYYLSLQNRQLDKALQMAQKAVEGDPDNPSFLDTLGWVYYQIGQYEQARKYVQASIDTGKASAEVLEHMGDIMQKLDKPGQARTWWDKAFEKDSTRTHLKDKTVQ